MVPKLVVGVHANVPASVPHESTPAVLAFTSQEAAFKSETTSDVDEAVPLVEIAVVEANGKVLADVVVAVK